MKRLLATTALLLATACGGPGEGERCNPALFTDECGGGARVCTYANGCGVAYCCAPTSTHPNCQACPTDDMGVPPDLATSD